MNEQGLKVIISAEIEKLKSAIEEGKKKIKEFGDTSSEEFQQFSDVAGKAGEATSKAMAVVGTALAAVGAALIAASASTEEYRKSQAMLSSSFEQAGMSADTAKTAYNDLYAIIGETDQATEAAQQIAMLADSEQEVAKWSELCAGVVATFGDALQPEAFYEAANETMKLGEATGAFTQMLEQTGVMSVEEFNAKLAECGTEAEKQALMLSVTEKAVGSAGDAYRESAASLIAQNEAQARFTDSVARIGEAIQPVITALYNFGATILEKIAPAIEEFAEEYGAELVETLGKMATAIGEVIGWIVENWDFVSGLATVIGAIVIAIQAVNAAVTIYAAVQALANTQMLAAYAVIVLIVAIIVLLIVYWDDIKNACQVAAEAIGDAFSDMADWLSGVADSIKNSFGDMADWFKNLFETAIGWIKDIFGGIGDWFGGVKDNVTSKFETVKDDIGGKFEDAKGTVQSAWSNMGSWFSNIYSGITSKFTNIGSWFSSKFSSAASAIKNAFSAIPNFFNNIFNNIKDIFSDIGTKITNGLTRGFKNAVNTVLSKVEDVVNAAISGINGAIRLLNAVPGVNIGLVNELSIPRLAKGGVVDSATIAMFGEAGTEAVIPLENNLGWLDKLAGMLNDRMGGSINAPIVLQVDGKTFAEISVNSINQLTKQTGNLPLVLV